MSRFQSLDGLRAIAVCAVLIGHLRGTRGLETLSAYPRVGNTLAHLGVEMFFVISGFLITVLLVKEQRETGQVSLRQFYASVMSEK